MSKREIAAAISYDWFLEFLCHEAWHKFMEIPSFNQGFIDMAMGLISTLKDDQQDAQKNQEMVFLMLTTLLLTTKEDEEQSIEPQQFDKMAQMVSVLSALFHDDHAIADRAATAFSQTQVQRLLALCRQDQYDTAQAVFDEVTGQLDKPSSRKLQAILQASTKPHRYLKEDTFPAYLSTMTEFLGAVYHTFPSQALVTQQALHFLNKGGAYQGTRSVLSLEEITEDIDNEELSAEEERDVNMRLKALRMQKQKEAADCVLADRHQQQSDNKGETPAENSEVSSSSRQSRQLKPPVSSSEEDMAVSEEDEEDEEDEEREPQRDLSLHKKMPLEMQPFKKRQSLAPRTLKLPSKGRQVRRKWTSREEADFYVAVQKFGVGNWQDIRLHLRSDRSNVQLKDKWRTICNTSYRELHRMFGPVEDKGT